MTRYQEYPSNDNGEGLRIGVVVARFNQDICDGLLSGAINGESALTIRADKLAVDSRYAKIMQVMHASAQQRPRRRLRLRGQVSQQRDVVHDVRVQSGVVTPSSERRYSRSRKPRMISARRRGWFSGA